MERDALLQGEMIGIRYAIARQNPSRCMTVLSVPLIPHCVLEAKDGASRGIDVDGPAGSGSAPAHRRYFWRVRRRLWRPGVAAVAQRRCRNPPGDVKDRRTHLRLRNDAEDSGCQG